MERFFETYSFDLGNRTVSVFDLQVCLYQKRRNGIFLCLALLRDSLWDRRMFVWLVPHGYDLGGSVGIIAVNFIIGGLIGGVILTWRLVIALWYIPLTIYRLLAIGKESKIERGLEE